MILLRAAFDFAASGDTHALPDLLVPSRVAWQVYHAAFFTLVSHSVLVRIRAASIVCAAADEVARLPFEGRISLGWVRVRNRCNRCNASPSRAASRSAGCASVTAVIAVTPPLRGPHLARLGARP